MEFKKHISLYGARDYMMHDTLLDALQSACGDIEWNHANPLKITLEDGTEVISKAQISDAYATYTDWLDKDRDDDYDPAPWLALVKWCEEKEQELAAEAHAGNDD